MDGIVQKDSQKDKSLTIGLQRMEVVCGPTGRRRWSVREKARIVCESLCGDSPVSMVARRNGVRANQLFAWRRQAREGKLVLPAEMVEDPAFAPVLVGDDTNAGKTSETDSSLSIEIEAGGVIVRVSSVTPASRIGEIAAALRSAK